MSRRMPTNTRGQRVMEKAWCSRLWRTFPHEHYNIRGALRDNILSPNDFEREMIAEQFENLYGYPGVCGCIDGCHITITAPLEQPQRYVDRHHNYSILLQGICDHKLLFRDVFVGQPGRVGDKRTFNRSEVGQRILKDPNVVGEQHLLGHGGYTLTSKLLIPYRDNGHLNCVQKVHNYYLARCRSCIERAFALLKGKWRRLKFFPNYCLEYAVDHIIPCVTLHILLFWKVMPMRLMTTVSRTIWMMMFMRGSSVVRTDALAQVVSAAIPRPSTRSIDR